jgi:hypothetical protein
MRSSSYKRDKFVAQILKFYILLFYFQEELAIESLNNATTLMETGV